jgi:hypothetical protein
MARFAGVVPTTMETPATLFQNHQWSVTGLGIKTVDPAPYYWTEAENLNEATIDGQRAHYSWPIHMAEATWINTEAFLKEFSQALKLHKGRYKPDVDASELARSFVKAPKTAGCPMPAS